MKKQIKTVTVGYKDQPSHSYVKGRVTLKEFNKAFKAEGWSDPVLKDNISYEYWRFSKRQHSKSDINDLKAEVITITYW